MLAVGLVLVALNAMRAGLLTRMLGYIGIASGAMMVLFPLPIVQIFWLGCARLRAARPLAGRRPAGLGDGRAVPWPTPERPPPRQRRGAPAPAAPGPRGGAAVERAPQAKEAPLDK